MDDNVQLVAEYQRVMKQIQECKESSVAMETRLGLKDREIEVLKENIQRSREILSLQVHAMKELQKPLLVDPSIESQFASLRNHLSKLEGEFVNQKSINQNFANKHMPKGTKLYEKWQQETEEMYGLFEDYAQGRVQDLHLQIELSDLKIAELRNCLDEYKQLAHELEKEAHAMDSSLRGLEATYKAAVDQLDQSRQEGLKPKR